MLQDSKHTCCKAVTLHANQAQAGNSMCTTQRQVHVGWQVSDQRRFNCIATKLHMQAFMQHMHGRNCILALLQLSLGTPCLQYQQQARTQQQQAMQLVKCCTNAPAN
jgi:hypothetical protein